MVRAAIRVIGGLLLALGILWMLQGLRILDWPPGSFMLAQRQWAVYGAAASLAGAAMVVLSRHRGR